MNSLNLKVNFETMETIALKTIPTPRIDLEILHRCKQCKKLITTESNIHAYSRLEEKIFKDFKAKNKNNKEFLFFIKEIVDPDNLITNHDKLPYVIDKDDKKIKCRKCGYIIGRFIYEKNKTKINGILKTDDVDTERIEMFSSKNQTSNKNKIEFFNKILIDNTSIIKNVKTTNEIISSFTKDFFRHEMLDCSQRLTIIDQKINKIYEILEKDEI